MAQRSIIKRVMLFALSLWVMQISVVFAEIELPNQKVEGEIELALQHHSGLSLSVDMPNCHSEEGSSCESEHCVNCVLAMMQVSNEMMMVLSVSRSEQTPFNTPRQYSSIFYRPPQTI